MIELIEKFAVNEGINETSIEGLGIYKGTETRTFTKTMLPPAICWVVQGEKITRFNGNEYHYYGDRFLVASLQVPIEFEMIRASQKEPAMSLGLIVDPALLNEILLELDEFTVWENYDLDDQIIAASKMTKGVKEAFQNLLSILDKPMDIKVLERSYKRQLYYEVLKSDIGYILRNTVRSRSKAHKIAPVVKYLERHFQDQITIDELAKYAGMSQASLYEHFKSSTSLSPMQYLKRVRLHNAHMLLFLGKSAGDAAYDSGYGSQAQFSREFRRLFGQTPSEVRAEAVH